MPRTKTEVNQNDTDTDPDNNRIEISDVHLFREPSAGWRSSAMHCAPAPGRQKSDGFSAGVDCIDPQRERFILRSVPAEVNAGRIGDYLTVTPQSDDESTLPSGSYRLMGVVPDGDTQTLEIQRAEVDLVDMVPAPASDSRGDDRGGVAE